MASNFTQRALTTVIAGPLILWIVWLENWATLILLILILLLALREWWHMTKSAPSNLWLWRSAGTLYILFAMLTFFTNTMVNIIDDRSTTHMLFGILTVVWAIDIGAYIAGRTIGGPKLIPSISPNKTWAGLGGAMIAAAAPLSFYLKDTNHTPATIILTGVGLAIIAQAGDFLESWAKRKCGVKDSGTIIPGHGGILDRIDGLLAIGFIFSAFMFISLLFRVSA